jgi:hypothetical protein
MASRRSTVTVTYVTNGTTEQPDRYTAHRATHQRFGRDVWLRLYDEHGRCVRRVSYAEAAKVDEEISYDE